MVNAENKSKLTLVVGASTNPDRYAFRASNLLHNKRIPFIPIGIKKGQVFGQEIVDLRSKPALEGIHTISLYLSAKNQADWLDYLLSLRPKRIIFNPGTEHPDFFFKAKKAGIEAIEACTLVMLTTGQF